MHLILCFMKTHSLTLRINVGKKTQQTRHGVCFVHKRVLVARPQLVGIHTLDACSDLVFVQDWDWCGKNVQIGMKQSIWKKLLFHTIPCKILHGLTLITNCCQHDCNDVGCFVENHDYWFHMLKLFFFTSAIAVCQWDKLYYLRKYIL